MNPVQQRFSRLCRDWFDALKETSLKEETWDWYLAKGAGDRVIAGSHEDRYLLELLQNARDAVYRGNDRTMLAPGRIFVIVTDHGLAVANTGAPFRLDDKTVLKAVCYLQRSDKVGSGFIGHKGVGLKSILLHAGAFSIRSRIDGCLLRATFSRARTAEHLLDWLNQPDCSISPDQARYIREQLPRLPLFTQPHADGEELDGVGPDRMIIDGLLDGAITERIGLNDVGERTSPAPYTTVVYLPYRDVAWERLLRVTEVDLSTDEYCLANFKMAQIQAGGLSSLTRAADVWQELVNLDRRVLILLGEVGEFQFARFKDGVLCDIHRIDIEGSLSSLSHAGKDQRRHIVLKERRWSVSENGMVASEPQRSFIALTAPTELDALETGVAAGGETRESIRILLEIPHPPHIRFQDESLFLYYPIENENTGLPFLIHGPFRVNPSRTALMRSERAHNRAVLDEAVALLSRQLTALLASRDIRRWLPWILLPIGHIRDADARTGDSELRVGLCESVRDLLRDSPSVPVLHSKARPESVLFFPQRPNALWLLEGFAASHSDSDLPLYLLDPQNRESYLTLQACLADARVLSQASQNIGIGEIDLRAFSEALVSYVEDVDGDVYVGEAQARDFFLNLCDLFGASDNVKLAKEAAEILGEHKVPLLPAFVGNGHDHDDRLRLVRAELRHTSQAEEFQKASRVVFWRPASIESRLGDLPAPPSAIPVFFMSDGVISAEGAKAEGILSKFYYEWGTARFESRPDLFRRIADRTADLPGEVALPVLGYLAWLLDRILVESPSGAADLIPRPYAAIDLATLGDAVHRYGSSSPGQSWERLENLQTWAQIQVPVQGERKFAPADCVVFGPAWAEALAKRSSEILVEGVGSGETEDQDAIEMRGWVEAINRLADFRRAIARNGDDGEYPELAPPDAACWDQVLHGSWPGRLCLEPTDKLRSLFRLLLLLGVRVGPRVTWWWVNTRRGSLSFDAYHRSIDLDTSRGLFARQLTDEKLPDTLKYLAQSDVVYAYGQHMTLRPYHTLFSGGHSRGCRGNLISVQDRDGGSALVAWIWLPDLAGCALGKAPFGGRDEQVDTFREAIVAVWPSLSQRVLHSGWYCCLGWHHGRRWDKPIPSLAAFQLSQLDLWRALDDSHISEVSKRHFSASVMIAWENHSPPSVQDSVRFLPLFDAREEPGASIAQDLGIDQLSELSLSGAVSRLCWLLKQSISNQEAPAGCWSISEFGEVTRNTWLTVQNRLLARIVEEDPKNSWSRRAILTGGLALRAVRGDQQIAVSVTEGESGKPQFPADLSLAFFTHSPRYWEREAYADRWLIPSTSRLQTRLYEWAEALGAERIPPMRAPIYQGETVDCPEVLSELRHKVRARLSLLLGVFKAHQAEKLDEMARTVLNALDSLRAVDPVLSHEAGSSGLDEEGNLVFSYPAYQRAKDSAVVLAEGIALLVNQTTAVGDLQNALGAPRPQVELALRFRGIDLNDIIKDVSVLAHERFLSLAERITGLVKALSEALLLSTPQIDWQSALTPDPDWLVVVESLQALAPPADRALMAIHAAAPDLKGAICRRLLREVMDDTASEKTRLVHLLAILRDGGWPLGRRRAFAKNEVFQASLDLGVNRETVDALLDVAVGVTLIDQVCGGELEAVEEIVSELASRSMGLRSRLTVHATDSGEALLQHLRVVLNLTLPEPFIPRERMLIEWGDDVWRQLTQKLRELGVEQLSEVPENIRAPLEDCLQDESLAPLHHHSQNLLSARQSCLQTLERNIAQGVLQFDPDALNIKSATSISVSSEMRPPSGFGRAMSGSLTSDQVTRGRVAELFVLQVCWLRFLALRPEPRGRILDLILSRRRDGSGQGESHVAWGTKTALRELERRLMKQRANLITCSPHGDNALMRKLFTDLIEVANERGPGYDVLDPFGLWGENDADVCPDPRRVEIKAILQDAHDGSNTTFYIVPVDRNSSN